MRILSIEELKEMPEGTFYAPYLGSGLFEGLCVKKANRAHTWLYQPLMGFKEGIGADFDELLAKAEQDSSFDIPLRDTGDVYIFEAHPTQKLAVFSDDDLEMLELTLSNYFDNYRDDA